MIEIVQSEDPGNKRVCVAKRNDHERSDCCAEINSVLFCNEFFSSEASFYIGRRILSSDGNLLGCVIQVFRRNLLLSQRSNDGVVDCFDPNWNSMMFGVRDSTQMQL